MSARAEKWGKRWVTITAVVLLVLVGMMDVWAAETVPVLEQDVTEDTIELYLKYEGTDLDAQAQIGTVASDSVTFTGKGSVPVVTWLLLDNSYSISEADRAKAKELISDLVAGRAENERFTLCTYGEHLEILVQDSEDYTELKSEIDALESVKQESYLTDVLAELLDAESEREEQVYVRVIVISDGVDNNPGGLTRDELNSRLETNNVPVYTFGCETGGNAPILKELYSFSRQTGAQSWSLTDLDDLLDVVKTMGDQEIPVCAKISIPEELRDGSIKGVQLTFSDGSTAETQVTMPFKEVMEETASETEPTTVPEDTFSPEEEGENVLKTFILPYWPFFALGAVALAAVIVIVVVLVRKNKADAQIKPVFEIASNIAEKTDVLSPSGNSNAGSTVPLIQGNKTAMLSLSDLTHPERHFEVPLRGKVTIGRSLSNQVVLDYERSVSGTHCEIFADGSIYKLRDLHSSNGTFVNGTQVTDTMEVVNGSVIKLGRLELLVGIQ